MSVQGEQAQVELNLAADPVLRGICESDLHRIPAVPVELVEVFVVLVSSVSRLNRFCLLCPSFLTAAETKRRQQSAQRKVDYRDSRQALGVARYIVKSLQCLTITNQVHHVASVRDLSPPAMDSRMEVSA